MAEKKHYHDLIKSHKGDMKKSWASIINIINKHKKQRCQSKFKMSDGSVTENKQTISENFNDFFVNVGPTLAKCIPKIDKSPLEHMGNRLNHVIHEEIKQIIFSLKNSATGWDDILAPAYWNCLLNLLYSPCQLYAIFLCLKVSFLINWKLQMWSLCINQMTQCILITTDLCPCYVCYLKCLRELCILDYLHSWKLSKYCISTSMVSGGSILRIWLLWS